MALTPTTDTALIQEVDDAVREDQLKSFWSRYGRAIIGLIGAALLAYGGWQFWTHRQDGARDAASETLNDAITKLGANNVDGARKDLDTLRSSELPAYRAAALATDAVMHETKGDTAAAIKSLDALVADADADPILRDIAQMRRTVLSFDTLKPAEVVARMQPIMLGTGGETSALFPSAAELAALAHLRAGENDKAARLFQQIAAHPAAPASLKARATDMAGTLSAAPAAKGAAAAPSAPATATTKTTAPASAAATTPAAAPAGAPQP